MFRRSVVLMAIANMNLYEYMIYSNNNQDHFSCTCVFGNYFRDGEGAVQSILRDENSSVKSDMVAPLDSANDEFGESWGWTLGSLAEVGVLLSLVCCHRSCCRRNCCRR